MIDFLFGFIGGLALDRIVSQLLSRRRCSSGLRLGANQITKAEWEAMRTPPLAAPRRVQPGELVMPWQRQHLVRAEGFRIPPEQPLTAQRIRYEQWRDEQVRQALKNDTTPPATAMTDTRPDRPDRAAANDTAALLATKNGITPGPFSEHDLREAWNSQADQFNQWDSLDTCEQLAWAQTQAIAADRARRPALTRDAEAAELAEIREALRRLRRWGRLSGGGFNADVVQGVADWIDAGMIGPLPPLMVPPWFAADLKSLRQQEQSHA